MEPSSQSDNAARALPAYWAKLHHDNDKRCIFQHGRWAARVQDSYSKEI